jgi:hypothetical protein
MNEIKKMKKKNEIKNEDLIEFLKKDESLLKNGSQNKTHCVSFQEL